MVGGHMEIRGESPEPLGRNLMAKENSNLPEKAEARLENRDISLILNGWDYEAGAINVRKIPGLDGKEKLQMRLDLGVLQMEMTGRPDGQRPHGFDSYLDFIEEQLTNYKNDRGGEDGFVLRDEQCAELREEALMYYHRYLSLFILGDFPAVARDTARNLRVLDLCGEFGADEHDRLILEQYRPYIIMMNTRATATLEMKDEKFKDALNTVTDGLDRIREFFQRFGQQEAYDKANEVKILKRFARDIRRKLPVDPMEKLQNKLARAIKREDYEEAARLRDEIQSRKMAREGSGLS
jgi:hypothetical protein